jgi:hypothetical protein
MRKDQQSTCKAEFTDGTSSDRVVIRLMYSQPSIDDLALVVSNTDSYPSA